ncbi:MAG: FtsQ-type POTRA domain-containing protein [Bacilli bacterium]
MVKKKKKRRLKVKRFLTLLIILSLVFFALYLLLKVPIMNIVIKGNSVLSDQEIIHQANLDNYPSFILTLGIKVKSDVMKNKYVENVKVTKGLLKIKINVQEKKILYIDKLTNKKITMDGIIDDDKMLCVPYFVNNLPKDKYSYFLKAMNKLDRDILCKMSEIKYDPNDIDKDRYIAFMNDGNYVYLTVNKFSKLNKYNTILESVGKKSGTLYLDYGDYFQAR